MSITTDMQAIENSVEHQQARIAKRCRNIFKDIYDRLKSLDADIEKVSQSTSFDAIPGSIKQPLNTYWQLIKSFNAAVEADPDLVELLKIQLPIEE